MHCQFSFINLTVFYIIINSDFFYIVVEVPKAAGGFREFLKTLKKPAAQDVNDKCKV